MNYSFEEIDKFIENKLSTNGFAIRLITQQLLENRLDDIMLFVNSVIHEYSIDYNWQLLEKDYFINPLNQKFKYSFFIERIDTSEICFLNFSSMYGEVLHNHCTYAGQKYRGFNLAKYHIVYLCNTALKNNIILQEGYWPKHNNGSIVLFLKMGWKIEDIRKNGTQLFMLANNQFVRDNVYGMLR